MSTETVAVVNCDGAECHMRISAPATLASVLTVARHRGWLRTYRGPRADPVDLCPACRPQPAVKP